MSLTNLPSNVQFLRSENALAPTNPAPRLISEYVQGRRIMPRGTPFAGLWDNGRTPYLVEIMDDMSPYSPIQHSITMKARKLGMTAAAENVVGYWMDANPTACEYVTATDELAEDWSSTRLEPLIDSLGFRHKLADNRNVSKSRKTGDKTFKKIFMGGYLDIISAQSMKARRAGDIRVLIRDEIDGPPPVLSSGEGYWMEVLAGHTSSWGARAKIMDFSSPTTFEASEINRQYELGDMRKFIVPCPFCEKYQELLHLEDDVKYGIKPIIKDGRFIEAVYICQYCFGEIRDYHKDWMLPRGHWQPTKENSDPTLRSRQISTLYSPVGMYSWDKYYRDFLAIKDDPESERTFTNIRKGLPYVERGTRPELKIVEEHRGRYHEGEIQPDVLYLTAGVDVQEGKEHPLTPDEGPRLEMEIMGHGQDYRSWSLLYKKFYGPVDDPYSGAWEDFFQWCIAPDPEIHKAESTIFTRSDAMAFPICAVFVDSSDGKKADVVYGFCSRADVFIPSKGTGWVTEKKLKEKGDMPGQANFRHYSFSRVAGSVKEICEVSTNYYKGAHYSRLRVQRRDQEPQASGYCDFPIERDKEYFDQLRAEERREDGSFHKVKIRNEALDCRVYAMCAGESYLMGQVKHRQEIMKKQEGATQAMVTMITPRWLLAQWATALKMKG